MRTFTISSADLGRCPTHSLLPSHWRADGTCRHLETPASLAAKAELEQALAELRSAREKVAEARRKLAEA